MREIEAERRDPSGSRNFGPTELAFREPPVLGGYFGVSRKRDSQQCVGDQKQFPVNFEVEALVTISLSLR